MQNDLAWQIVSDKTIEKPDLELAETIANRANEAARGKDPDILDTQARVLFMKGQKEEAVQAQTKAVALAEPDQKQAMQSRLDSYQKGELPPAELSGRRFSRNLLLASLLDFSGICWNVAPVLPH